MLEKVRQGAEVIVEQGDRTVAIIKPVQGPGRPIDECIALAKAHESGASFSAVDCVAAGSGAPTRIDPYLRAVAYPGSGTAMQSTS